MLKVATVCTGIGAPEKALTLLEIPYELTFFSEIDNAAIRSYCAIHGMERSRNLGDLAQINYGKLPKDIDLIVGGTPCQDFSNSGIGKGCEEGSGTRSSLMWYYLKLINALKPKVIVWENVAAVISKKHRRTYRKFFFALNALGYKIDADLLNAKYFNVPQNRVRIFLLAQRKDVYKPYVFPVGYDSGVRLRHCLLNDVPEKYFTKSMEDVTPYQYNPTPRQEIIVLGKIRNSIFKQNNRVLSIDGICTCLTTKDGDWMLDSRIRRKKSIRKLRPLESMRLILRYRSVAFAIVPIARLRAIFGVLYNVPWQDKVYKERYKTQEQLLSELPLLSIKNSQAA